MCALIARCGLIAVETILELLLAEVIILDYFMAPLTYIVLMYLHILTILKSLTV